MKGSLHSGEGGLGALGARLVMNLLGQGQSLVSDHLRLHQVAKARLDKGQLSEKLGTFGLVLDLL